MNEVSELSCKDHRVEIWASLNGKVDKYIFCWILGILISGVILAVSTMFAFTQGVKSNLDSVQLEMAEARGRQESQKIISTLNDLTNKITEIRDK